LASFTADLKPACGAISWIGRLAYRKYSVQQNKSVQQDFLHFGGLRAEIHFVDLKLSLATN
jgi:hypothetical protein